MAHIPTIALPYSHNQAQNVNYVTLLLLIHLCSIRHQVLQYQFGMCCFSFYILLFRRDIQIGLT